MMEILNTYQSLSGSKAISLKTIINASSRPILETIDSLAIETGDDYYHSVDFVHSFSQEIQSEVNARFHCQASFEADSYIIKSDESITVYSKNLRGLLYGTYTIAQMTKDGKFPIGLIFNKPVCPFRGLKIYLPAPEKLDVFYRLVDMLCFYRFNTVIIEVGGAMEYKLHPEINRAWVDYSVFMSEYSGKSGIVQEQTYKWKKNSVHSENGGGKYLSQDTVRELLAYCKERDLDVIPEIPSLSHSDYMLINHRDLAERADDPYPDTYCPSNPETYALLFDIIDEVMEVFRPGTVHMGHDEYYSIAICEKCRNRQAQDIFADDVEKIRQYLAGKGAAMMIWSDKLLNAIGKKGQTWGGSRVIFNDHNSDFCAEIPATYPAIDNVSREVICMHWYWGIRKEFDDAFLSRGFKMTYGNFEVMSFINLSQRLSKGVLGGSPSNWSHLEELNLQRNGVHMSIAYAAYVFWNSSYSDDDYSHILDLCFKDLFTYLNKSVLTGPHLRICHTSTMEKAYVYFGDGVYMDLDEDLMGEYTIEYADGSIGSHKVIYGVNISGRNRKWTRHIKDEYDEYDTDKCLHEVAGAAVPVRKDGETWYDIVIANPQPQIPIKKVSFFPKPGMPGEVLISAVEFVF